MKCFKQVSERADLCFRNIMPEFHGKSSPRELLQWSGDGLLPAEWEGAEEGNE